jgi:hypothetical protein
MLDSFSPRVRRFQRVFLLIEFDFEHDIMSLVFGRHICSVYAVYICHFAGQGAGLDAEYEADHR